MKSSRQDIPRLIAGEPESMDVLCGKTKGCIRHEGTLRFKAVIQSYTDNYSQAKTKYEKMTLTKEIYDSMRATTSRFLKYNDDLMAWEEISSEAARDKIGHSLRFANKKKTRRSRRGSSSSSSVASSSSSSTSCSEGAAAASAASAATGGNAQVEEDTTLAEEEKDNIVHVSTLFKSLNDFDSEVDELTRSDVLGGADTMVEDWLKFSTLDSPTDTLPSYHQHHNTYITLADSLLMDADCKKEDLLFPNPLLQYDWEVAV